MGKGVQGCKGQAGRSPHLSCPPLWPSDKSWVVPAQWGWEWGKPGLLGFAERGAPCPQHRAGWALWARRCPTGTLTMPCTALL